METKIKKSHYKLTVTILAVVFVLSLTTTIVLAAFSAGKSGSVTLSFADGLTMVLAPKGNSGRLAITGGGADEYTFSYAARSNKVDYGAYDGFTVTLNKLGWIALRVELLETTSGSDVAPLGSWQRNSSSEMIFRPTGTNTDWVSSFFVNLTDYDHSESGSTLILTSLVAVSANTTVTLVDMWSIKGRTNYNVLNDLSGRAFKFNFTVKAHTEAAPTFS